ncbi:MAG: hypothetical protein GF409_06330 [Candidatus Omnitrophica bacterium]|nr:hypothetical protein [Candidatus Omnitrophota bacterium]
MKNSKISRIMAGIGIAGLVAGMSVNSHASSGKTSCGKGSCGKGGEKGFFQALYDGCKGPDAAKKAKSSCGKGSKKEKGATSCGKGSCGR